jgi:hypothetical protein
MQTFLRTISPLIAALAMGCVSVPGLTEDTATADGTLADGTRFVASGGVFGGTVDDGTGSVPPLDATFRQTLADGRVLVLEVRAPVAFALPARGSEEAAVCVTIDAPVHVDQRCDLPAVELHLDEDSADCNDPTYYCRLQVAGALTVSESALFNGVVRFAHHEGLTSVSLFGSGDPPNPSPE